ncbi:MAG: FRG domain-containing protein [Phycisphaerae bacterium]|nr:FRG domain-containing protein [Phycisphaerae bacterium]
MHPADVTWPSIRIVGVEQLVAVVQRLTADAASIESPVAWRGLAKIEWTLRSTLDRALRPGIGKDEYVAVLVQERAILERFRVQAERFASSAEREFLRTIDGEGIWNVMALGRHSGLPTRIVDWSASPMVAAYFACMEHADSDGVVWWFVQKQLDDAIHAEWDGWGVPTRATVLGCDDIDPVLQSTFRLNERYLSAAAFDEHSATWIAKLHHRFMFPRMEAQQGFMTVCGRVRVDHNEAIDSLPGSAGLRRGRLVIDRQLKRDVMRWLAMCNISAQSLLYPGIDHVSRQIASEVEQGSPL